jgi:hypothetical protein
VWLFGQRGGESIAAEEPVNNEQKPPRGWDDARIREVLAHYKIQSEDEQAAEIEAAHRAENVTLMAVPADLVPEVRALIARKQSA